jgi:hypothetical protein
VLVEAVMPEVASAAAPTSKHFLILSNSGADHPIAISKDESLSWHPTMLYTAPGALRIIAKLST